MRLLLVLAIFGIAAVLRGTRAAIVRVTLRATMLLLALGWLALVGTGLIAVHSHKWAGQIFIILVWLATPLACGAAVAEATTKRRWTPILHALVMLAVLAASFITSFSGYIERTTPAEALRFLVLHIFAGPSIILAGVAVVAWASREYGNAA